MPQAYCMKCKSLTEIRDPKRIILSNLSPAWAGLCSSCGTKVVTIASSAMDPIFALRVAISREKWANGFYLLASRKTKDRTGQKMFNWLAKQESTHIERLEDKLKSVLGSRLWNIYKEEEKPPLREGEFPATAEFEGIYNTTADEETALKEGIKSEESSVLFYTKMEDISSDPDGQSMFASLARSELEHLSLLRKQLESFNKHKKFLSIKE